ncbi:MAG TPA: tannase/feruloyl esterase family alpha/beta hydrolase [Gammaproteobacteria bacterium]
MPRYARLLPLAAAVSAAATAAPVCAQQAPGEKPDLRAACEALADMPNLSITRAVLKGADGAAPEHCYVQGVIGGRIRFHMQLPLPDAWNGRLLNIGDGGKDGQLNFADERLAQGYAVANSNTGHDSGAEPGASFAHENLEAVIDFGHRAVHLTANASKAVVRRYYGRGEDYAYFEGCSTGGRQGLMEAQRYPADFDGIVAGAPVFDYQRLNVTHVWMAQQVFKDKFAGNLAFDADGDGVPESLTKWEILRDAVMAKCDAKDGIRDGIIDDPRTCDFAPRVDLANRMCPAGADADDCFTERQIETIEALYRGPHDSRGVRIFKGMDFGSEWDWDRTIFPHAGNGMFPAKLLYGLDHVNFLFYETSPGVPMSNPTDVTQTPDKSADPPEFAWWEFDVDDVTAGAGDFMMAITDATDPDLSRFLHREDGRLLMYHGWADPEGQAEPTLDFYEQIVDATFGGDLDAAREKVRLFMVPGMGHCGGGPGPSEWDRLAPLVAWVEQGAAPEYLVAAHRTNGVVDNERRVCPYPQRAVYVGPAGGQNDPANWVEGNFECR